MTSIVLIGSAWFGGSLTLVVSLKWLPGNRAPAATPDPS